MSQSIIAELVLGHCRRKITLPKTYAELLQKAKEQYADSLPKKFKFFYRDSDNDLISVSTEEDYDVALDEASSSGIELIIYPISRGLSSPRWTRPPSYSITERMRSDTFCNLQEALHKESPQRRPLDPTLEESKEGSSDKSPPKIGLRCATYPKLPEELNFTVVTQDDAKEEYEEKTVPTKEIDKNEEWPQSNDEVACLSCLGRKLTKKGKVCKKCNGTGRINAALKRHMEHIIQREVTKAVQAELERKRIEKRKLKGDRLADEKQRTLCKETQRGRDNLSGGTWCCNGGDCCCIF